MELIPGLQYGDDVGRAVPGLAVHGFVQSEPYFEGMLREIAPRPIPMMPYAVAIRSVPIVAVATAFTGVISFVGLIVPHILRMLGGADNRFLILGSALTGATLLSLADLVARLSLRPAELPIGIVTSVVGVPVFLSLLRRRHYVF